ncbi:hypothetical protein HDU98_001720 [Podochytrium sp. JEL0797]|nr:hypothetical protein HDU98_001720 [Podochytrium sp. JEL0797]
MFPILTTLVAPAVAAALVFYVYLVCVPGAKETFLIPKNFLLPPASSQKKNILLLVAHPDDECMFFGPTVSHLAKEDSVVLHAVSVSNGNFDGLGAVREKEFVASCKALGIAAENVSVLDDPRMQDGMKVWWKQDDVSDAVFAFVQSHSIDTIITFDKYGISGHPNHRALFTGVQHLLQSHPQLARKLKAYSLLSVPLLRKFISVLDLLPTFLLHFRTTLGHRKMLLETKNAHEVRQILQNKQRKERVLFVNGPVEVWKARKAMGCHKSQMVWFRHLYLVFSRYMIVNELQEI